MVNRLLKIQILIVFFTVLLSGNYGFSETAKTDARSKKIKVRIQWPEVENAVSYKVLIRNRKGEIIINTDTGLNSIELEVIPGKYGMRIGSINKFYKIGSWSDWTSITVKSSKPEPEHKPEPKPEVKEKEPEKTEWKYRPLKIGVGASYVYVLPDLDDVLDNTYMSGGLLIGYGLGNLIPFSFFRHVGIEAESGITWLEGEDKVNGDSLEKTDILAGGNIFFTTGFKFPLNLIIRAGGGIAFTHIEYKDTTNTTTIDSQDLYYKVGSAIEITYSNFFIELGADYNKIMYIGDQFSALYCTVRAGVKF